MLSNFNKRGETQPVSSVPVSIFERYGEGMIGPPTYINTPTRADAPR
ncbi:hypothetical protein HY947_05290 [Candidatus Gottesmanbacteria bacterium]|nr:hypothetical protein [Candidatus Gottesmanbacteria bacterium]